MPDETNRPVTILLFLKANGTLVVGKSTQPEAGGIECLAYELNVTTTRDAGSGMATGRRQYEPLLIRKRTDQTSPALAKVLSQNQVVDATLKFFRKKLNRTYELYYTVNIAQGRIASLRSYLPDPAAPAGSSQVMTEEVSITFNKITWTHVPSNSSVEDEINSRS